MSNLTLATVEGTGNFLPIGSVVSLVDEYPAVFEHEGLVYTQDDVPGRVIPDFDTKVPSAIKGYVKDNFAPLAEHNVVEATNAASIAPNGTIVRAFTNDKTGVSRAGITIQRKAVGEATFTSTFVSNTGLNTYMSHPFVRTDNKGSWVVSLSNEVYSSSDDGLTWSLILSVNTLASYAVREVKFGSSGVLLISAQGTSSSTISLYITKDLGKSWEKTPSPYTFSSLVNTEGTTWYALVTGNATFYKSTDDGLTWSSDGVLPAALAGTTYKHAPMWFSAGRFYVLDNFTVKTGTSLTTLASLTGTYRALGVDDKGNAVALSNAAVTCRSTNGAAFVPLTNRLGTPECPVQDISYSNGVYVDRMGSFITEADLVAGKAPVSFVLSQASYMPSGACGNDGIVVIPLNISTYMYSTDFGRTFVYKTFDTPMGSSLSNCVTIGGVATDSFGNWAVLCANTQIVFYSNDNGLTWSNKTLTGFAAGSTIGISGGGASGTFIVVNYLGDYAITNNGFSSVSVVSLSTGLSTNVNAVAYHAGQFYWIVRISTGTQYSIVAVDAISFTRNTYALSLDLSISGFSTIVQDQGKLYVSNNDNTFVITPNAGAVAVSVLPGNYLVYSVVDGVINNPRVSNATGVTLDKIGEILVARRQIPSNFLWTKGIRDLSLPVNSYIKVS